MEGVRVGVGVGQVLCAVHFDRHAGIRTEQVHVHMAPPAKGDRLGALT